ncbi:TolC family protein [Aliagarivorans taiwanensis]|uniref:TolC family protein n=1 Tax=Aliagarivorans taiwanensis TaxID=561966 RepID=UPI000416B954|nr:TolC family protein [Aliagarivorans taiwanensis]
MFSKFIVGLSLMLPLSSWAALSLEQAEQLALALDPANQRYSQQQASLGAQAIANSQLPDPMLRFGVQGLPTDSFALDQDPMTQLQVGLSQQFSRGDSLTLTAEGYQLQAQQSAEKQAERALQIRRRVRELWFQLSYVIEAQQLVAENQRLLEQNLRHIERQVELGLKQSQDLLQGQLQLAQLTDQAQRYQQLEHSQRAMLISLVGPSAGQELLPAAADWPTTVAYSQRDEYNHSDLLLQHPSLLASLNAIAQADTRIALAEERFKPAFKVELGYGHRRARELDGSQRSDMLSGFVTMDLPLFTDKRQNQQLIASEHGRGMALAERDMLLQEMNGMLNAAIANYQLLQQRRRHYQQVLLPQAQAHIDAVEQGFESTTSDFNQVIQSHRQQLMLQLELLQLDSQANQALAQIRYFQGS